MLLNLSKPTEPEGVRKNPRRLAPAGVEILKSNWSPLRRDAYYAYYYAYDYVYYHGGSSSDRSGAINRVHGDKLNRSEKRDSIEAQICGKLKYPTDQPPVAHQPFGSLLHPS